MYTMLGMIELFNIETLLLFSVEYTIGYRVVLSVVFSTIRKSAFINTTHECYWII